MSPFIPISTLNISPAPGIPLTSKRNKLLSRCSFPRAYYKQTSFAQKYVIPLSTSIRLFPQFRLRSTYDSKKPTHVASATGTDFAVEESDTSEVDNGGSDNAVDKSEKSDPSTVKSKRPRSSRKSEMPPVKNEDLVPGTTFTGKVKSIQPFGAFVDFGAFTDGLVHVSRLSDSFVKDVSNVVTVGQEVTVRLIEANFENGRISLSMRESDDPEKQKLQKDASSSDERSGTQRKPGQRANRKKDEVKKTSKFTKGQDLQGTVKNLTRSGAFISLPEGEEGFLPTSEEANEGFGSVMGESSLEIGQEVDVRVLRISRGQVTLTMKKEEDDKELNSKLSSSIVHKATNPFVLAFRSNKEISEFLDERVKEEEPVEEAAKGAKQIDSDVSAVDGSPTNEVEETSSDVITDDLAPSIEDQAPEEPAQTEVEEEKGTQIANDTVSNTFSEDVEESSESAADDLKEENQIKEPEGEVTSTAQIETELSEEKPSVENEEGPEVSAEQVVEEKANDVIEPSEITSNTAVPSSTEVGETAEAQNGQETDDNGAAQVGPLTSETTVAETENELQTQIPSSKEENTSASSPKEQSNDSVAKETTTKVTATISPALVKQLREETGAGMMDCKKALSETDGDINKAYEYLRKKGLASADKKASRATAEGRIGSYIHDSRIGILIEVNCETDFVARGDIFKELVEDIAMQVAACPQVKYINTEDVPKEIVDKETEIEMQKEDLLSKPEQIRSRIVEGRVRKMLEEMALLEQPFIKDDKIVVKDWVKQRISTVGENIKVKRFVRYNLGEGLEKKSQDFAAEVAAQTAAKPASAQAKEEPVAASETKETTEAPPKAVVSAALVKQLREETGAGMMDCKKALSESDGDLEKAHEYLRKKGLSSAEKKSKRLAAEGRIGSYIHDSRIGVLIEVNCETDFVGRSQTFKELVDDLAMQAVACPQVKYVSIEDIPESIVKKEKELEMQREDLQSKPENIREKIVEGRITKRLGELALLEQPFIKNDGVLVKDLVKQTVATIGENIKVRRFVRFTLGETGDGEKENEA